MASIVVTEAETGQLVALQPGDELVVQLSENPSTGYAWTLEPGVTSGLTPEGAKFRASDAVAGGGGVREFRFLATEPGVTDLRLKLWREWEGDRSVARRFHAKVTVDTR